MNFKKRSLFGSLAIASSLLLAACGGGDEASTDPADDDATGEETYEWRFATEEWPGQVQYEYAQEFADKLNEKSDGRINIDVYEFGGLGSEVDQVEMLQTGGVEFGIISPGFTGTLVPEGNIFALQFLFPDDLELNQQILNESEALNTHLAEKYLEQDIMPLAFWHEGAMQWTGSSELRTPEDFEGFQMRTQESPLILESYRAYGAEPTPMSWDDLYLSLEQGIVDGQENPIFFIEDANFHEVQEHMTLSQHNIYVTMTTVNPTFFEGLPEDIQDMILETTEEMRDRGYEIQKELNEELLTVIEEDTDNPTEVIELTEEERDAFRQQALPVRDFYVDEVGEDGQMILDMLEAEIEEALNE
ncbi:TRAP transporter substrate-binding protein DctP [Desertibacillus haloalkaliphilus]|uniref:TRAP transporter substrate-binding protein DctP n=1 Tax=Desertibacillus haloalkaliphilus TaxID=1328930 RepID=UPI001C2517DD|nr:TRAP transporter substrate-binding protein DctP [Desertibacillus haloalkaliphilus]MBU8905375.1 TRAP transporter substrate-binding protein DctP [Desertibacillus haloalkaliphilus]